MIVQQLKVKVAESFFERAIGLLACSQINPDQAMLFPHCSSVHTFWMKMPIDIVFLDKKGTVLRIFYAVPAWRVVWCKGAESVLEMASGAAKLHEMTVGEIVSL
jgi:uncharacterized protein